MELSTKPLWPHQEAGIGGVLLAIGRGERRICLTSPTGAGKTRMVTELIERWCNDGMRTVLYTNRLMLMEQLSRELSRADVPHGIRAAGYPNEHHHPVQISSIQTEGSRAIRGAAELHLAHRVVIDEAHIQKGGQADEIVARHLDTGAAILGVTATPIGLAGKYDTLIVAGTTSELRACGALVPAIHYACDEPDLKEFKKQLKAWSGSSGQDIPLPAQKVVMSPTRLFGSVLRWYGVLNPTKRPAILFAAGVEESLWFAQEFDRNGIPAAHVDGDEIWRDGGMVESTTDTRRQLLEDSKNGTIKVICNRFVLREGIDAPWLSHCIFATIFGSPASYVQSGGRILRAYPGLECVTIQDHGGNWHRHQSLNADRIWELNDTAASVCGEREDRLRLRCCWKCAASLTPRRPLCASCGALNEVEPTVCPQCQRVLAAPVCKSCGWQAKKGEKVGRPVLQSDGSLRMMAGDLYLPKRVYAKPNGPELWKRYYWRARSRKTVIKNGTEVETGWNGTFKQAIALFAQENYWSYPSLDWPLMPRRLKDLYRLVKDVPPEALK